MGGAASAAHALKDEGASNEEIFKSLENSFHATASHSDSHRVNNAGQRTTRTRVASVASISTSSRHVIAPSTQRRRLTDSVLHQATRTVQRNAVFEQPAVDIGAAEAQLVLRAAAAGKDHAAAAAGDEEFILEALRRASLLLSDGGDRARAILLAAAVPKALERGQWLMREGENGENLFVVKRGRLEVLVAGDPVLVGGKGGAEPRQKRVLAPGDVVGELALLHSAPRSASVRALEPCKLWSLGGNVFREVQALTSAARMMQRMEWVTSVRGFIALNRNELSKLVSMLRVETFQDGVHLLRAGVASDRCYLIEAGFAVVSSDSGGSRDGGYVSEATPELVAAFARAASVSSKATGGGDGGGGGGGGKDKKSAEDQLVLSPGAFLGMPLLFAAGGKEGPWRLAPLTPKSGAAGAYQVIPPLSVTARGTVQAAYFTLGSFTQSIAAIDERFGSGSGTAAAAVLSPKPGAATAADVPAIASPVAAPTVKAVPKPGHAATTTTAASSATSSSSVASDSRPQSASSFASSAGGTVSEPKRQSSISTDSAHTTTEHDGGADGAKDGKSRLRVFSGRWKAPVRPAPADDGSGIGNGGGGGGVKGRRQRTQTQVMHLPGRSTRKGTSGKPLLLRSTSTGRPGRREGQVQEELKASDFESVQGLGSGSFGSVSLVRFASAEKQVKVGLRGQQYFALKALSKQHVVLRKQVAHVRDERALLSDMDHPFVLRLHAHFQDRRHIYLLTEAVVGGEMFQVVYGAQSGYEIGTLPAAHGWFYSAGILDALCWIHGCGVAYRDLKPENIMLDSQGYPKIIDFGFAKRIPYVVDNKVVPKSFSMCGTHEYLAPELIFYTGHDRAVDFWAFGALVFEFVTGNTPFQTPSHPRDTQQLLRRITDHVSGGESYFPHDYDRKAGGATSRDLVKRLLEPDASKRLGNGAGGPAAIRRHEHFAAVNWQMLRERTVDAPWLPKHQVRPQPADWKVSEAEEFTGQDDLFADW